jgi:hypothetical protein
MRAKSLGLLLPWLLLLWPAPSRAAEFLAADLSTNVVKVSSNFTGTEVILFGAFIQTKQRSFGAVPNSDVIVVVKGPPERTTVRRKGRVGPIWMNVEGVTFEQAPSFYLVASTMPLSSLSETSFLDENEIGLEHLHLEPKENDLSKDQEAEFRQALISLRQRYNPPFREHAPRYAEITDSPECRAHPTEACFFRFSSSALFNAHLPIPANVPIGKLKITLYFLRNGHVVPNASQSWVLDVSRTGLEGWLYKHAQANPILYGLGAILIAVMAGGSVALLSRS